jgi:hypothetical protein
MKRGFLDLLDPSNDPEFFWQVISGPPCIYMYTYSQYHMAPYSLNGIVAPMYITYTQVPGKSNCGAQDNKI